MIMAHLLRFQVCNSSKLEKEAGGLLFFVPRMRYFN